MKRFNYVIDTRHLTPAQAQALAAQLKQDPAIEDVDVEPLVDGMHNDKADPVEESSRSGIPDYTERQNYLFGRPAVAPYEIGGASEFPAARITGPASVEAGKALLVSASTSTGQGLRFAWTANGFNPASSTQSSSSFVAPNTAGTRSITLTVTDERNRTATASHSVNVTARPVSSDTRATISVTVSDGRGGVARLDRQFTVKPAPDSGNCGNIPAWSPAKVYSTYAESVSYNGKVYKQNFYSINKPPDLNSAAYSKEWQLGVPCP
ncbi:hypothetical protein [Pseudomonas extremaustralis]